MLVKILLINKNNIHNISSPQGFVTDGAARAESKLAYTMPSRDGGRQSQIRSYVTRGLQIPVNPFITIFIYIVYILFYVTY